ncbi:MAG: hypothetical protein WCJ19_00900 [bacterium]
MATNPITSDFVAEVTVDSLALKNASGYGTAELVVILPNQRVHISLAYVRRLL